MPIIPCDYTHPQGTECQNGQVIIYGEIPVPPPRIITCPNCNGTGKIEVTKEFIQKQIQELIEQRNEINIELRQLRKYLI